MEVLVMEEGLVVEEEYIYRCRNSCYDLSLKLSQKTHSYIE